MRHELALQFRLPDAYHSGTGVHGQVLGLIHTPVRLITTELPSVDYRTSTDVSWLSLRFLCLSDKSK